PRVASGPWLVICYLTHLPVGTLMSLPHCAKRNIDKFQKIAARFCCHKGAFVHARETETLKHR
ncbi:MAG: hypothetical protein QNJ09_18400, partial [Paracoccaceae bacterium]|nr:hypothetical protein [Paracoccaceae bacterium]